MNRFTFLIVGLLSLNLIPSFGQTGKDTACYNRTELERITNRVVYARECDTLLKIAYLDVAKADSVIAAKDSLIAQGYIVIANQEKIINGKQGDIDNLLASIDKNNRKTKWLKAGWATTSAILVAALLYVVISG